MDTNYSTNICRLGKANSDDKTMVHVQSVTVLSMALCPGIAIDYTPCNKWLH